MQLNKKNSSVFYISLRRTRKWFQNHYTKPSFGSSGLSPETIAHQLLDYLTFAKVIAIYAPMIYTVLCFGCVRIHYVGKWEEGWALEIESFLGPVKWHRAER